MVPEPSGHPTDAARCGTLRRVPAPPISAGTDRHGLVPARSGRPGTAPPADGRTATGWFRRVPAACDNRRPSSGIMSSMTRDELLLAALAAGDASTAALVRLTGLMERTCRYGLRHLIAEGYAWSPERGTWRLTEAGRAVAWALPGLPAAGRSAVEAVALPAGAGGMPTAAETAGLSPPPERSSGMPASLGWGLAGLIAVVALAIARRLPTPPPEAPPSAPIPTGWPYSGWQG